MEGSVIDMMYIGEDLIACVWILSVVHTQNVYDHLVDDLYLAISLGMEVVDLVSLVSSIDHRLDRNVLRNILSRSEIIGCGIPKCTHTHSKNSLAVDFVVIFFL